MRAARRYGWHHQPFFDDVLQELVPDREYQRSAAARALWHKAKNCALRELLNVLCPVCRLRGVAEGAETCSDRCQGIFNSPLEFARLRQEAFGPLRREAVRRLHSQGYALDHIAASVNVELDRVADLVDGIMASGFLLSVTEQNRIIEGWDAKVTTRTIARSLNVPHRLVEKYLRSVGKLAEKSPVRVAPQDKISPRACEHCKRDFARNPEISWKRFLTRRYCSLKCKAAAGRPSEEAA